MAIQRSAEDNAIFIPWLIVTADELTANITIATSTDVAKYLNKLAHTPKVR